MQDARRQKICHSLLSFRNSTISTYIIFHVTVGSEVKPGGYAKKTPDRCPLYLQKKTVKRNWHLLIFPKSQLICLVSRICCQTKNPLSASLFSHRCFLETQHQRQLTKIIGRYLAFQ